MRAHRSTHMRSQEQAKSTGTSCEKSHFVWKFTGKNAHGHVRRAILSGNLQEKCRTRISRHPFCVEIYRKKRAWTLHKSHFVWKFTGKMPPAQVPTSIKHRASVPYRKNPFSVATLFGEKMWDFKGGSKS